MHGFAMASLQSAELGPPTSEYIGFILVEDVGRIGHVSDRSTKWMHVIV